MAQETEYLAGKNATCTIDGIAYDVEDGTINHSMMTDEVTNNLSGGRYADVATIEKATVSGLRIVYNVTKKPTFKAGDLVAVDIAIPNGPSLTGPEFRVGSMSSPVLSVRSAVRMTFDLTSQNDFTYTLGT